MLVADTKLEVKTEPEPFNPEYMVAVIPLVDEDPFLMVKFPLSIV